MKCYYSRPLPPPTQVPLIMRVPWMESSVEKRTKALVELVDVYQTVCDVMGLDLPDDTVRVTV